MTSVSRKSKAFILKLCGAALIVSAGILVYWPALQGAFLFDDDLLLTENPIIKAPDGLFRIWCTTEPNDYWPVTNSCFWLEWRLWGMNSTGYHVVNLSLHLASAILIWVILRQLAIPGSWLAAFLFAVHPVNVESVAWIAEQKNTLSLLFFLISIFAYVKAEFPGLPPADDYPLESAERLFPTGRGHWYWCSWLSFILAMLSKGSVAVLPFVLLLISWWQRQKITKWDLIRLVPFFLISVVLTSVNLWFQTHGSGESYRSANFVERLIAAGAVPWFYLLKVLAPMDLAFVYPAWNVQTNTLLWWAPLIFTVLVSSIFYWKRNTSWGRPLFFAWTFFLVALIPVLGFVDVGFMRYSLVADHFQYLAIIGIVALVAALWSNWLQSAHEVVRWSTIPVAAVVIGVLGVLTWKQSQLYASPITLYQATIDRNPECWMTYYNLGIKQAEIGKTDLAIENYQHAISIRPDYVRAQNNLGNVLFTTGKPAEAIEHFEQALKFKLDDLFAHINLATAFTRTGQLQAAIKTLEEAIRLNPNSAEAHVNLGIALKKAGQVTEAIEQYKQALESNSDPATLIAAHFNLGIALIEVGSAQQAIENYDWVVQHKPNFAEGYWALALAYARLEQHGEAQAAAKKAAALARSQGNIMLEQQIEKWLNER